MNRLAHAIEIAALVLSNLSCSFAAYVANKTCWQNGYALNNLQESGCLGVFLMTVLVLMALLMGAVRPTLHGAMIRMALAATLTSLALLGLVLAGAIPFKL